MKKLLASLLIFIMLFSFSACKNNRDTSCRHEEKLLTFLPLEFSHTIPSEDFYTKIKVESDGCFTGTFYDMVADENGDDYPGGTVYSATFSGKFENIEKLGDTAYKLFVSKISYSAPLASSEIKDGIKYVTAKPEGLSENAEYILYTKDTPADGLHEVFLFNWPYLGANAEKLSCYGIMNTENNAGFFTN
ncbi:MAG: hypothetical protein J6V50_04300 [Clostridia bacterium]|nr:hypothetical protein [Clostridia bacterium]